MSDVSLVTGFPAFLAQCLTRRLLETDPADHVVLLCPGRFQVAAQIFLQELPRQARQRVEVLVGDPADMDLGLSGKDYRRLCERLTAVCHLGAAAEGAPQPSGRARSGPGREAREPPALSGTRHVVDLACDCVSLRRLCHVSSAFVSGTRPGVVLEEELQLGQRFGDPREEALLRAELLVRQAMEQRRLPAMVLRPGHVVGDSRTGEIDSFSGPYALMQAVLHSPLDVAQLLPALGWGAAPLHMVPVDFVTEASVLLLRDGRAAGLTFHLTDPCPLPVRAVGELVARQAERKVVRTPSMPPRLWRAVLRAPGVGRITGVGALEEALGVMVFYNCQNTLRLLDGTGLRCPPVGSYLERLVAFFQQAQQAPAREDESTDPLD